MQPTCATSQIEKKHLIRVRGRILSNFLNTLLGSVRKSRMVVVLVIVVVVVLVVKAVVVVPERVADATIIVPCSDNSFVRVAVVTGAAVTSW